MLFKQGNSASHFLIYAGHFIDLIENSEEIKSQLARLGYDAQQLQQGRVLLRQLSDSVQDVEAQKRSQKAATDTFHTQRELLNSRYQIHIQAARRALGREANQLLRATPKNYGEWMSRVQHFYQAMQDNPTYREKLIQIGLNAEELLVAPQMMETVISSKSAQGLQLKIVQDSVQQRDRVLREVKDWFGALMAICRVAFRNQPKVFNSLRSQTARSTTTVKTSPMVVPPAVISQVTADMNTAA